MSEKIQLDKLWPGSVDDLISLNEEAIRAKMALKGLRRLHGQIVRREKNNPDGPPPSFGALEEDIKKIEVMVKDMEDRIYSFTREDRV